MCIDVESYVNVLQEEEDTVADEVLLRELSRVCDHASNPQVDITSWLGIWHRSDHFKLLAQVTTTWNMRDLVVEAQGVD